TEESNLITSLWQGAWAAAWLVGALVWGLIAAAVVLFRRRKSDVGLPAQVRYNVPIEVLYTTVPIVVVLFYFVFTARDQERLLRVDEKPDNRIEVIGKRWSWDFNYLDAQVFETGIPGKPPTLYLPRGESVRFDLASRDVIHSFWAPAFLFKLDVFPGRTNTFQVTPTKTGKFAGKCAELCGVDHSRMLFTVEVVEPAEFDRYLQDLRDRGQVGRLPADNGPSRDPRTASDTDSQSGESGEDE
ncbi:MAG: cytochrome c oxidase subunit II, partial [Actinomycetota bacterium]|nr:cytochrome c oxidase subunit II [Actinomycetota bacterium]